MIVNLPPHAIDLLADGIRQRGLARGPRAIRFVRQHRERGLEPMSEIARLDLRAVHVGIVRVEQRIQVRDQRLHLGRVVPLEPCRAPGVHVAEPDPQARDRRHAAANAPDPGGQQQHAARAHA